MPATDTLSDKAIKSAIRTAAASGKAKRISDGAGLYLEARPNGAGWWRLRFWTAGKEGMVSLGTYPDVSLKMARAKRDERRRAHAEGTTPAEQVRAEKAARAAQAEGERLAAQGRPGADSFEHTAREWHAYMSPSWSATHAAKVLAILENDLLPFIGVRPLRAITPPDLLREARRIEARGAVETAYRAVKAAGAIFRFGVQHGRCESDPSRDLKGAVVLPVPQHRAAVTDPAKLGELLRAIDGYQGTPVVRAALALAPMVFLRPGELRHAEWVEFDLAAATWTVPAARMKGRLRSKLNGPPHIVPLAPRAVEILRELQPLTGTGRFVFSSPLSAERPMSDNAILSALRRMGFPKEEVTGHGFRATARTIAVEHLGVPAEIVEAQLAHAVGDTLGRAYNRTQFMQQRRELMMKWADYLLKLKDGASLIQLRAA